MDGCFILILARVERSFSSTLSVSSSASSSSSDISDYSSSSKFYSSALLSADITVDIRLLN
jgi:hypothetical protein